jgi:hypothetical protein
MIYWGLSRQKQTNKLVRLKCWYYIHIT